MVTPQEREMRKIKIKYALNSPVVVLISFLNSFCLKHFSNKLDLTPPQWLLTHQQLPTFQQLLTCSCAVTFNSQTSTTFIYHLIDLIVERFVILSMQQEGQPILVSSWSWNWWPQGRIGWWGIGHIFYVHRWSNGNVCIIHSGQGISRVFDGLDPVIAN